MQRPTRFSTDSEIRDRDTSFMEYCAKIAEESENPVPMTTISRNFVKENNLLFSELYFLGRFKKAIVNNILESEKYSLEKKAKIFFVTSTEIGKRFLEKLRQTDNTITLDNRNRITSFQSKDGRFIFEGVHSNSGKKRKHRLANFNLLRSCFSGEVMREEEKEDESLDGGDSNRSSPNRELEDSRDSERAESLAKRVKQESVQNVETRSPAPASPRVPQTQLDATDIVKQENVENAEGMMPIGWIKQEIYLQDATNSAGVVGRGNQNDRIAGPPLPQVPELPVPRASSTQVQGSSAPAPPIVQQTAESSRPLAQLPQAQGSRKPPAQLVGTDIVKQENVENAEVMMPTSWIKQEILPAPGTPRDSQIQEQERPRAQVNGTDSRDDGPAEIKPFGSNGVILTPMHVSNAISAQPPTSSKNFYVEFSKAMYYFLVDVGDIRISGLQDLYRCAMVENEGQDMEPSTIKSYFEICLDKISLDVETSHDEPVNLNRFLRELLQVAQESGLKELELAPIITKFRDELKSDKLVQKASVQKAFTEMMDSLKARCGRKLRLGGMIR